MKILVIPWAEINSLWLSSSVSHLIFQNQSTRTHLDKPDYFSQKEFQSVYWIFLFCFAFFLIQKQWGSCTVDLSFTVNQNWRSEAVLHNTKLPLILPWSMRGSFGWGMNSELCPQALLTSYLELQCNCNWLKKGQNLLLQQFFDYRTSYSCSSKSY